jgi:hypothetical protein
MNTFNEIGYQVVENAISQESAKLLATEFQLLRDVDCYKKNLETDKIHYRNDEQVEKAWHYYSPICFESLMLVMLPKVEEVTGKKLYPAYSYARIYYNGATMRSHTDRESCQYSTTITIEVDETGPWDIWMKNLNGESSALSLPVGSMAVYRGDKLDHWRTEYTGKKQIQAFLHYVEIGGEYDRYKFDRRPMLALPPMPPEDKIPPMALRLLGIRG